MSRPSIVHHMWQFRKCNSRLAARRSLSLRFNAMKTLSALLTLCIVPWLSAQQTPTPSGENVPLPLSQSAAPARLKLILKRDTPVKVRLNQQLSSDTSKVGDEVSFTVTEDVVVGDRVVTKRGTLLNSTVTHAKPARASSDCARMSSGKLDFSTPELVLTNGKPVRLDYVTSDSRFGAKDVVTWVVMSPIAVPAYAALYAYLGVFYIAVTITHPAELFPHKLGPAPPGGCHAKLEDHTFEKDKAMIYYVRHDVTLRASDFQHADH